MATQRPWVTATGLAGLNGGDRCRRAACETRWGIWQWSCIVVRCRDGPGYHKRGPGWLSMSPLRRSRREAAAGDGPPFGEKTSQVVLRAGWSGGTEPVGCLTCRQHWFLPGEGFQGCLIAPLTPSAAKAVRKKLTLSRIYKPFSLEYMNVLLSKWLVTKDGEKTNIRGLS